METRKIIEKMFNDFKDSCGVEPQYVCTDIRWKDCGEEQAVTISWGDGESDPHDDEVFFHCGEWNELSDLFSEDNGEDFVCINIEDAVFGIW